MPLAQYVKGSYVSLFAGVTMIITIECRNPGLTAHKIRHDIVNYLKTKPSSRQCIKVLSITHKRIVIVIDVGIANKIVDELTKLISRYGVKVNVLREINITT